MKVQFFSKFQSESKKGLSYHLTQHNDCSYCGQSFYGKNYERLFERYCLTRTNDSHAMAYRRSSEEGKKMKGRKEARKGRSLNNF